MAVRSIVRIDEDLCTGCGLCVMPCAEGAIRIVDGKAKVMKEEFCDGAGVCLGTCPEGAITIEQREAEDFDLSAALAFNRDNPIADHAETAEAVVASGDDPTAFSFDIEEEHMNEETRNDQSSDEKSEPKKCMFCERTENEKVVLKARYKGEKGWVCTACLPSLIHG